MKKHKERPEKREAMKGKSRRGGGGGDLVINVAT